MQARSSDPQRRRAAHMQRVDVQAHGPAAPRASGQRARLDRRGRRGWRRRWRRRWRAVWYGAADYRRTVTKRKELPPSDRSLPPARAEDATVSASVSTVTTTATSATAAAIGAARRGVAASTACQGSSATRRCTRSAHQARQARRQDTSGGGIWCTEAPGASLVGDALSGDRSSGWWCWPPG